MLAIVERLRNDLQIFYVIVEFVTILVVDVFFASKASADT